MKKVAIKEEEEYSSEDEKEAAKKRNPDTECYNPTFEQSMKDRSTADMLNFKMRNVEFVHSLNSGRPLQQRIEIPDHIDVSLFGQYSGQRLNNWEFQK